MKAGGRCLVDIPFQTGDGGMASVKKARKQAMTSGPHCEPIPTISMNCTYEVWKFKAGGRGRVEKGTRRSGYSFLYMGLINLGVVLALTLTCLGVRMHRKFTTDEDILDDVSTSLTEPLV